MSKRGSLERLLEKAKNREKEYAWLEAAELYEQALRVVGKSDFLRKGEIQERSGYCFYRAAFQGETQEEFKQRMRRAIKAYEKTHESYEKLAEEQKARVFRTKAMAKYLGSWLTSNPSEKRRLLDECLELEGKVLAIFSEAGNMLEYGKTYYQLSHELSVFFLRMMHEWDRHVITRIAGEGIQLGEKAIASFSKSDDLSWAAGTYITVAICNEALEWFAIADPDQQEKNRLRAIRYFNKAAELSEKAGDDYFLGWSHFWLGFNADEEQSMRCFEKAFECGEETQDIFLKAAALGFIAYTMYFKALVTEDPDKRMKLAEEAMGFYDKAQHLYSIVSYLSPRGGVISPPGGYVEHYLHLSEWETDPEKKRDFLQKSENVGVEALKVAEDSEVPSALAFMLHILSKTYKARARLEADFHEKKRLLEKALDYIEKCVGLYEQWKPFVYWNIGVMYNELANIKAEMGYLEPDRNAKRILLEEAVSNKEKCLASTAKRIPHFEKKGAVVPFVSLYGFQDTYWTLLDHLYKLTNNPKHLRKSIEIAQNAIETAAKLDMTSLMAESYWKMGKTYDILQEHLVAAENFEQASESYLKAAEKIPQLKDLYQDYACYMRAWSEIQKAKLHHKEKKYGEAKEHYEKAAYLHKSTRRWIYLSPNYLALSLVEAAEDLSRREQTGEARNLFQQAAELFLEAKESIEAKLKKIEAEDEKELAAELGKASDIRREYCLGRIILEEAKILDRKGDHVASSARYGSAAEVFQKIARDESGSGRRELQPIVFLCQAWEKMMMAEAKASSTMYGEAAELFNQAKEYTLDQPTTLLALANSSFCKALQAGTEFEIARDMGVYATAKKHLEAAANHYVRAGFKTAAEYAKATEHLFDAYIYIHKAQTETEPRKKMQHYQLAEKLLETSAGSYMKAKHPEKSEEIGRLLESVKERRQLAVSLTEVLHAPTIASTTTSFSTPTPTQEQAVGLERFEHADIQANLILRVKEVKVGEDIDLEIELINAGKAPALLIKVEKVIPESFEIKKVPEIYRVEDSFINMKGKRLDPLKTEDVKIVAKPQAKGTFTVKPRILYIDDTGKYKSHEPEPVTITVKELGIKGWIRGER